MKAARHIEAGLDSFDDHGRPMIGKDASRIGDAHDQGLGSRVRRLANAEFRNAKVRLASGKAELTQTPIPAPIYDPLRRLGCKPVAGVSEEKKIGGTDLHTRTPGLAAHIGRPRFLSKVPVFRLRSLRPHQTRRRL